MLQVMKRKDAELDSTSGSSSPRSSSSTCSLTPLDNLDRAIDAAKKAGDKGPLAIGVMATLGQIMDVLKRFGVTPIEALGSRSTR